MFDDTKPNERHVDERREEEDPQILEADTADRGEKPNTCRFCAGSKFC